MISQADIYEQIRQRRRARDVRMQAEAAAAAQVLAPPEKAGLPKWVLPVGIGVGLLGVIVMVKMK